MLPTQRFSKKAHTFVHLTPNINDNFTSDLKTKQALAHLCDWDGPFDIEQNQNLYLKLRYFPEKHLIFFGRGGKNKLEQNLSDRVLVKKTLLEGFSVG